MTGQVGELVVTEPMPSMPLYFWNDPDGARYHDAYFATFPGVWRHGDWMEMTDRGSVIMPRPVRLHPQPQRRPAGQCRHLRRGRPASRQLTESLVIGAELADGGYWHAAVRRPRPRRGPRHALKQAINSAIAAHASPRHVPDDIIEVAAIPHTRTGKKLEVPVKRIIQGRPLEQVVARDAVDDYAALAQFTAYARRHQGPPA